MGAIELLHRLAAKSATETVNPYADFTITSHIIEHPVFVDATRQIALLHLRKKQAGVFGGLLITGQSGSGKSTLARSYQEYFPRDESGDRTIIPVLTVAVPESPTVKSLAEAVLIALGDPNAAKGTKEEKTHRVKHYLKECKVELIIFDEFHHFLDGGRFSQALNVTDWLKLLMDDAAIPIVLLGLPRSIQVLRLNPQLRRRFSSPFYLRPFSFGSRLRQLEFRGFLKKVHSSLPLECPPLHEANLAKKFYFASHGLVDYIARIIDRAVWIAGDIGAPGLSEKLLAESFRETVWRDAPDNLNPFEPKASLRYLDKPGEPFQAWEDAPRELTGKRGRRK